MSKRKPMDKAQVRERRNRLLESAAAAELSLTEGVREMRAIAGMTQEEFAQHRGVSARVIKALELGQGNPTVATLNRIGEFFGLEVAFVPMRRSSTMSQTEQPAVSVRVPALPVQENIVATLGDMQRLQRYRALADLTGLSGFNDLAKAQENLFADMRQLNKLLHGLDGQIEKLERAQQSTESAPGLDSSMGLTQKPGPKKTAAARIPDNKKKSRSS